MIAADAISQHATDSAALDACIAAGTGSCGGVAYNPGVAASIQWSARGTGGTFTMNGVTFYAFAGCRRARSRRLQEQSGGIDENNPLYQASLPSGGWWKEGYSKWAKANAAPALPPYTDSERRRLSTEDDLPELMGDAIPSSPDIDEDHHGPWSKPTVVRKKTRRGSLWGRWTRNNPNDRI